jgi:Icc-related predicted phosphoesterase
MSTRAFFASDLHGRLDRYEKLLAAVAAECPAAVLLGGDLLPFGAGPGVPGDFLRGWLGPRLDALRESLGPAYPRVLAVFGNDDPRAEVESLLALQSRGLAEHAHGRRIDVAGVPVYGYACIPPSPFLLKDWERYDVSRFVDPGSVSPEEGTRSVPVAEEDAKWGTMAADLEALVGDDPLEDAVLLLHAPPYGSRLDRAALDGRTFDHAPLDTHVGSMAVRRLIEARQPRLSLHGHVHESARLTRHWCDRIGRTLCISAAHDGDQLALVRVDLEQPDGATRELL